jgi:histone deacetylase 1/2
METPIERLLGETPDYTFFKVFGCACWPHLRPYNNRKLQFRSKQCVFLGYSSLHKGYKCLHVPLEQYLQNNCGQKETLGKRKDCGIEIFPFKTQY